MPGISKLRYGFTHSRQSLDPFENGRKMSSEKRGPSIGRVVADLAAALKREKYLIRVDPVKR